MAVRSSDVGRVIGRVRLHGRLSRRVTAWTAAAYRTGKRMADGHRRGRSRLSAYAGRTVRLLARSFDVVRA